jgi:hypothetical protein
MEREGLLESSTKVTTLGHTAASGIIGIFNREFQKTKMNPCGSDNRPVIGSSEHGNKPSVSHLRVL